MPAGRAHRSETPGQHQIRLRRSACRAIVVILVLTAIFAPAIAATGLDSVHVGAIILLCSTALLILFPQIALFLPELMR